jgi:predicted 2-oxoglutarate/Fe(II)-dependent dioxygenase YbiX
MIDNPLTYILIQPNIITPEGLCEIKNHIENSNSEDLSVFDPETTNKTGEVSWVVDKKTRDTQIISAGPIYPKIEELLKNTVKNVINPFYDVEVTSSEIPQILSYSIGGHYKPHIDGESIWISPTGEKIWKKSTDRDLTILFFLNDDFEGGDFIFPDLKIRVRPEPGMLVCFPSTHFYTHGVEPVTQGKRYSIVTWATIKGCESMDDQNRRLSHKYGVSINN